MNERLRELMVQADYPAPEMALRAQKLAELIVRACADIAEASNTGDKLIDSACWVRAHKIQKHFGVESTSIKVGSRVKVVSGFNVGAKGTVSYIEPTGRMWVMRDGASTDVFYTPDEVVRIEE